MDAGFSYPCDAGRKFIVLISESVVLVKQTHNNTTGNMDTTYGHHRLLFASRN